MQACTEEDNNIMNTRQFSLSDQTFRTADKGCIHAPRYLRCRPRQIAGGKILCTSVQDRTPCITGTIKIQSLHSVLPERLECLSTVENWGSLAPVNQNISLKPVLSYVDTFLLSQRQARGPGVTIALDINSVAEKASHLWSSSMVLEEIGKGQFSCYPISIKEFSSFAVQVEKF